MMEERIFGSDSKESGDKIDRFDFAPALILLQTIWKLPITIRPVVGAWMGINHSRPFSSKLVRVFRVPTGGDPHIG